MSDKRLNAVLFSLIIHLALLAFVLPKTRVSGFVYVISYLLIYLLPILLSCSFSKKESCKSLKRFKLDFTDLYYVCLFFLAFSVLSVILSLLFPGEMPEYEFSVISLLTAGILAPIFEELLWRGLVFNLLSNYSKAFAMLYSSLLFALLHTGTSGLIYAFVGGMIFSYLHIRSGSLLPGIILHLMNNLVSSLSPVFPLSLRIALTFSLTVIVLSKTLLKKHLNTVKCVDFSKTDNRIFTSPLVYLTLVFVVILRYL